MGGVVRPLLAEPAKHLIRLARDPVYRTWRDLERRLASAPRRSTRMVRALGMSLEVPDPASFLVSFEEIFVERMLSFASWGSPPRILDLGANIGLSQLYFLREHPDAWITALEPDPALFRVLQRNVIENGGGRATLMNRAAWNGPGRLRFRADGADGGRVVAGEEGNTIEIEAIDTAALFDQGPFDVVKMDIEGAESVVLPALRPILVTLGLFIVEYHAVPGRATPLAAIVEPMEAAGLTVQIRTVRAPRHPFRDPPPAEDFEQILHVYGVRR